MREGPMPDSRDMRVRDMQLDPAVFEARRSISERTRAELGPDASCLLLVPAVLPLIFDMDKPAVVSKAWFLANLKL